MSSIWEIVNSNGTHNLKSKLGFGVEYPLGCGMPPVDVITTEFGLQDGSLPQKIVYKERPIKLVGTIKGTGNGTGWESLLESRQALISEINRDAVTTLNSDGSETIVPFTLKYTLKDLLRSRSLLIDVLYKSGLEMGVNEALSEKTTIELLAPDPLWYEENDDTATLAASTTATASYLIRTTGEAQWEIFATITDAATPSVDAILETSTDIYIGGNFDTVDGITCNNIARYTKATGGWSAMGSGATKGCSSLVSGIKANSVGLVYIVGDFQQAGGTTVNRFCSYDPATNAFGALGGATKGVDGFAYDLAIDTSDNVYVVGSFANAGGSAAVKIVKWTGSAFATMGGGLTGGTYAYCVAVYGSTVYAGGNFTVQTNIAKCSDGSTWAAMGSGRDGIVKALTVDGDGVVYAGGEFTNKVSKWDGSAWTDLSPSISTANVETLYWDSTNSRLYFGANNGEVGYYENDAWNDVEVTYITGSGTTYSISGRGSSALFGFDEENSVNLPATTTVTNGGTARAYPTITVTGPGSVSKIINTSTGARLAFTGLTLVAGETMTVDLTPGSISMSTNVRDNLVSYLARGCKLSSFFLKPGDNDIAVQIAATATVISLTWKPKHHSLDAVVLV